MLLSELSADNSKRYLNGRYGRQGWTWNTKGKYACIKCRKHVVAGRPGNCPVCGQPLFHVSVLPRSGKKHWKNIRAYQQQGAEGLYPTAIPRHFPNCRLR